MVVKEVKHLKKGDSPPPPLKEGIRLYSMRFGPYCDRGHLVLDSKKIKYETVNINISDKPEWYLEKIPTGKAPAIELPNGDVLHESLIMADYIDEQYPDPPLYPKDPMAKAKDKLLIQRLDNILIQPICQMMLFENYTKEIMDELLSGVELMEKELASRKTKFFGGSRPGMLDLMVWPWCVRIELFEIIAKDDAYVVQKDKYPRWAEWLLNMKADEGVKESYLEPKVYAEFFRIAKTRGKGNADFDMLYNAQQ